ncbi:hypothetical protein BDN70DRAFT_802046 [Pholiota conissans]|uniref:Uncharacterized protein n=1 Tax=Pholiota conissans TaxID=109636 RepID=A0A9P5Z6Q9_9AGAR|nr:hypothetical protein BDN70DRAFT_802046 [Pholiota conissans]
MIILDREEAGLEKEDRYGGLTLRHPSAAYTRSSSLLLPDYNTSEALHYKLTSPAPPPRQPRVDPRIWKAALYALAVYIFLSLVIIVPVAVIKTRKQSQDRYRNDYEGSLWDDIEDAGSPSLLQLSTSGPMAVDLNKTCNVWQSPPSNNTALARYRLPPSGLITLRSNATYDPTKPVYLNGNLVVQMNKDVKETSVVFNLAMAYSNPAVLKQTNVPPELSLDDQLGFDITVLLPQVKATVDVFITYLPMLSQSFGELGPSIKFGTITLEGAARPIVSQSLQAQQISVKNVAASIEGTYNVTASLTLDTVKGPVSSNITLTQTAYPMRPILLEIDSGDSQIMANVMLDSSRLSAPSKKSPAFGLQVRNFNGPTNLTVAYAENSPNTTMLLRAQNNLAPTKITMDPRYQGTFSVKTKMDQVTIKDYATEADDPAGSQKSRTLQYTQTASDTVSGWAGWGPRPMRPPKQQSAIDIFSALSPVLLNFGLAA